MRASTGSALLLLCHCCLLSAAVAPSDGQSIWAEPIQFQTKSDDLCEMLISGHGEFTKLRISCRGSGRAYWCEYLGTPHTCRPYNKNPRHFFVQIMWNLRKLRDACQGPRLLRPHMCKKASDDSQMVFQSASPSRPDPSAVTESIPVTRSNTPRLVLFSWANPAQNNPTPPTTPHTVSLQSSTPPAESTASRMARYYCWRSMQAVCTFLIRLVRH